MVSVTIGRASRQGNGPRRAVKSRLARGRTPLARLRVRRVFSFVALFVTVLLVHAALGLGPTADATSTSAPLRMGLSFSHRQADYLTMPWTEVYGAALGLTPALIRLGAYWDEIERSPGQFNFTMLDAQLDRAAADELQVVLTVGMKAPRWPEYYIPSWLERQLSAGDGAEVTADARLRERALAFVDRTVRHVKHREAIVAWQVENEPLDPAGPHRWRIGRDFLAEEVALVRRLDRRPVVVTMFLDVNPLMATPWRQAELHGRARTILDVADVLGLDVYPARGFRSYGHDWYFNWPSWVWEPTAADLRALAIRQGKQAWVMEAQAEPWEPNRLVYTDRPPSRSVQPRIATAVVGRLADAGFDTILLWGVEHWYMRRERLLDDGWWEAMASLFPQTAAGAADQQVATAPAS